jgi:Domain of unknown function (DUF4338)/Transposase DNA-binding/Transposase Tn5 dimerisation domain
MIKQNQIKRVLALSDSLATVRQMVAAGVAGNRAALANAVCERFGFYSPKGLAQTSGCVKALRELERAGHFVLPPPQDRVQGKVRKVHEARCLGVPVDAPHAVPAQAEDVQALRLTRVDTQEQLLVWNQMMKDEHPQGAGPLVGTQIRYLIESKHGVLGGFGFAAAAIRLADRDAWIGWNETIRQEHLNRVIGMARFLIRPQVRCHNLASRVMGMALRGLSADFENQYGYRPWLVESFVDTDAFSGTCYRAANWISVGHTKGRGRQDSAHKEDKPIKEIYVYPLVDDLHDRLGAMPGTGPVELQVTDGLDGDEWASNEFGGANFGHKRLSKHLVDYVGVQAAMPGRAFCAAAQGDRAMIKAYYRFIDKPDDSMVNAEAILRPHHDRTVGRMKGQKTVLCIQDGTKLNYSGLTQCPGLGVIGSNQTGAASGGLNLHTTFVISTEGLPLGILDAQFSAPLPKATPAETATPEAATPEAANPEAANPEAANPEAALEAASSEPAVVQKKSKEKPVPVPLEEKKTFAWIKSLRKCNEVAAQLPGTQVISVSDRESDIYELFDEQRKTGGVDLLVRAKHDRCLVGGTELFTAVRQSEVVGTVAIIMPPRNTQGENQDDTGDAADTVVGQNLMQEDESEATPEKNAETESTSGTVSKKNLKLFAAVRESEVAGRMNIAVPRQSARPKKSKQKARVKTLPRNVGLDVRYRQVTLPPPKDSKDKKPITLWVIHARENAPPPGVKPVEWFLLTTIKIETADQALECLRWYCLRWRIEDWHRVLKSGCKIEELQHKSAERLQRAIAINIVIAWRIMLMTLLGREQPAMSADVLFSDIEMKVLTALSKKKGHTEPILLGNAVRLVAQIGGYIGRANDPPPGHELMWHGYARLQAMCEGYELFDG